MDAVRQAEGANRRARDQAFPQDLQIPRAGFAGLGLGKLPRK
jgi:hypothetical protein